MLILIAGITGMCGQPCAQVALDWGHQVRGMGRNAGKLADKIAYRLESFVSVAHYYDLEGLRNAVAGVDAVICAYNNSPELVVGAQLALLYAAEKAGVKIFHAASWNYDWTTLQLGEHENYDAYIAFKRTVEISSTMRPLYGFTGGIIEYPWYRDRTWNAINVEEGTVSYFGTGTEEHIWVTLNDLAAYTICAVSDQQATAGGLYYVESFRATFPELGRVYGEARGIEIHENCVGDTQTAQQLLQQARESTATYDWNKYIGLAYITAFNEGKLGWKESIDSKRWVGRVHQTDWRSWLAQHQDV
ncbi:hypothetical protein CcaCcLH18_08186 [Colletotrichum camelliae]|nr:hypothetical protein CcaCcLH18_08186 [Colletotrichum camelliae]